MLPYRKLINLVNHLKREMIIKKIFKKSPRILLLKACAAMGVFQKSRGPVANLLACLMFLSVSSHSRHHEEQIRLH